MTEHRYRVTFAVNHHPQGLTKEELLARLPVGTDGTDGGACDSIVLATIVHGQDGGLSTQIWSLDGATGESVRDAEIFFTVWCSLAKHLGNSKTLGPSSKALCDEVFKRIKRAILEGREPLA
jgi:hypothetical protein